MFNCCGNAEEQVAFEQKEGEKETTAQTKGKLSSSSTVTSEKKVSNEPQASSSSSKSKVSPSTSTASNANKMTKIAIVQYSMYGHITTLSQAVKKGVEAGGATCEIFQVPETLPDEVLGKMGAPPKPDFPIITPDKLTEFDGILFGNAGRFGTFSAQMKSFMDSTGGLWQKGALTGKAAGTFTSVGTQGGGQETVNLSCIPYITHLGMVFVPLGYVEPKVFSYDETHGASPYGCGTFAGPDGSRKPSDLELEIAESHGKHFAGIAKKLAA